MAEKFTAKIQVASEHTIKAVCEKLGIVYPSNTLGFFQTIYAKIEDPNLNKVRLSKKAVNDALPTLIGKQVNLNHWRKGYLSGFIMDAWLNDSDEIEISAAFFKDVYSVEWDRALKLMDQGKLAVSFELLSDPDTTEKLEDGTRRLHDIEFIGVGLLLDENPAYPGAKVFQMAKEVIKDLMVSPTLEPVFAKALASEVLKNEDESDSKSLTAEDRKAMPDEMFAVVFVKKNEDGTEKKVRKFPIHDIEHINAALSRLSQEQVISDLNKIGISANEVKERIEVRANTLQLQEAKVEPKCPNCDEELKKCEDGTYECAKCQKKYEMKEDKLEVMAEVKTEEAAQTTEEVVPVTEVVAEVVSVEKVEQAAIVTESTTINQNTNITDMTQTELVVMNTDVTQHQMTEVNTVSGETLQVQEICIREVKWTLPMLEEKMASDEAKIKEQELQIEALKASIEVEKEKAVKLYARKQELAVEGMSDEDYLDDSKFKMAKLEKENAELKAKVQNQPSKPETVTANSSSNKSQEVTALATGHQEDVEVDSKDALREVLRSTFKSRKGKK